MEPLHPAGRLVDSGEFALLGTAARRRRCQDSLARRRGIWTDRERGMRAGRSAVRAVLHCSQAGLAVLVVVQGVHPVLVHSRDRLRVPDDFRAVPVWILNPW